MEHILTQPITELISKRKSVRTYIPTELDHSVKEGLSSFFNDENTGPFGNKIDLHLLGTDEIKKTKLGTYGFISGANHFVAGGMKKDAVCWEDFGYVFQKLILFLTDKDLSSCWIGGTFNRSKLTEGIATEELIVPAITPIGMAAPKGTLREKLIRYGAKADSRKEWQELFYSDMEFNPLERIEAEEYFKLLEMVRLAPSASNKQPWRIVREKGNYHFFLKRSKGYSKFTPGIDLQKIDMGIAMCHFGLTAAEMKLEGCWERFYDQTDPDLEYISSWIMT